METKIVEEHQNFSAMLELGNDLPLDSRRKYAKELGLCLLQTWPTPVGIEFIRHIKQAFDISFYHRDVRKLAMKKLLEFKRSHHAFSFVKNQLMWCLREEQNISAEDRDSVAALHISCFILMRDIDKNLLAKETTKSAGLKLLLQASIAKELFDWLPLAVYPQMSQLIYIFSDKPELLSRSFDIFLEYNYSAKEDKFNLLLKTADFFSYLKDHKPEKNDNEFTEVLQPHLNSFGKYLQDLLDVASGKAPDSVIYNAERRYQQLSNTLSEIPDEQLETTDHYLIREFQCLECSIELFHEGKYEEQIKYVLHTYHNDFSHLPSSIQNILIHSCKKGGYSEGHPLFQQIISAFPK